MRPSITSWPLLLALHGSSTALLLAPSVASPRSSRVVCSAEAPEDVTRRLKKKIGRGKKPLQQGKAKQQHEIQRLHVTGGECRGRRLRTPDVFLRPMMPRVREALFSMLYPSGVLRDSASSLDLFAGAGTVGIECLSRGVGNALFVDFSPKCTQTIRENLETLGLDERGRVVQASVFDVLLKPESFGLTEPFDLVTMTPPYEEVVYADLMDALAASPLLVEDTMLVIEYPVELGVLPPVFGDGRFVGIRNRKYGRTVLGIYVRSPSGKLDLTPHSEEFVSL